MEKSLFLAKILLAVYFLPTMAANLPKTSNNQSSIYTEAIDLYLEDISKSTLQNIATSAFLVGGGAFLTYKQLMRLTGNLPDAPDEFLTFGPTTTKIIACALLATGVISMIYGAVRLKLMANHRPT